MVSHYGKLKEKLQLNMKNNKGSIAIANPCSFCVITTQEEVGHRHREMPLYKNFLSFFDEK